MKTQISKGYTNGYASIVKKADFPTINPWNASREKQSDFQALQQMVKNDDKIIWVSGVKGGMYSTMEGTEIECELSKSQTNPNVPVVRVKGSLEHNNAQKELIEQRVIESDKKAFKLNAEMMREYLEDSGVPKEVAIMKGAELGMRIVSDRQKDRTERRRAKFTGGINLNVNTESTVENEQITAPIVTEDTEK